MSFWALSLSCLIKIQHLFSSQSPTCFRMTTRENMWKTGGGGGGGGAETWWAEGMAQDHRTHRSFPRHPACQCPFCHFKHNTTDTPSSFTLDCYHGNSLFPAQSLEEDCLSQSSNKPYFRINTHARIIQTIPLCFTTFYFKWECKTFGVDCTD